SQLPVDSRSTLHHPYVWTHGKAAAGRVPSNSHVPGVLSPERSSVMSQAATWQSRCFPRSCRNGFVLGLDQARVVHPDEVRTEDPCKRAMFCPEKECGDHH